MTNKTVHIPTNSYTACLLQSYNAKQLYYNTRILSFGIIPMPWILDRKLISLECKKSTSQQSSIIKRDTKSMSNHPHKLFHIPNGPKHKVSYERNLISIDVMLALICKKDGNKQRIVDKWNEYVVILEDSSKIDELSCTLFKATRETSKDMEIFCQTHDIKDYGNYLKQRRRCDLNIKLDKRLSSIDIFNSRDNSFSIKKKSQSGKQIITVNFIPKSIRSTATWVKLINQYLMKSQIDITSIYIPKLEFSISLESIDFHQYRPYSSLIITKKGYNLQHHQSPIESMQSNVRERISTFFYQSLPHEDIKMKDFLTEIGIPTNRFTFNMIIDETYNWKINNYLFDTIINYSCLDPKITIQLEKEKDNKTVEFPEQAEGFLIRLFKSKVTHNHGLKVEYFYTANYHLLFQPFYCAEPLLSDNGYFPKVYNHESWGIVEELLKLRRAYFNYCPFPTNGSHIKWLNDHTTREEFISRDDVALREQQRRSNLISNTTGLIDIRRIKGFVKIPKDYLPLKVQKAIDIIYGYSHVDQTDLEKGCFDIVFENDMSLRLIASSGMVANKWIQHLDMLRRFWMKIQNPQGYPKNMILNKYGYAYCKSEGNEYRKVYLVLTNGYLLVFRPSQICEHKNNSYQGGDLYGKILFTIELSYCYIYTDPGYEINHSNMKKSYRVESAFARLYTDGTRNQDEADTRTLFLHLGNIKLHRDKINDKIDIEIQKSNLLEQCKRKGLELVGIKERSYVLQFGSKLERDEWMVNIKQQTEKCI